MSIYLFHLHECHTSTIDEEGQDFENMASAVAAAKLDARRLMAIEVASGKLCMGCQIEVVEATTGQSVIVPFSSTIELADNVIGLPNR